MKEQGGERTEKRELVESEKRDKKNKKAKGKERGQKVKQNETLTGKGV